MREAGVDESLVLAALGSMSTARVLPFRFLAAARYAPQWEEALEQAMLKSCGSAEAGRPTIVLVDVSGSMTAPLSHRSEMQRTDAAYGLAVLLREIAEKVPCVHSRTRWSKFRHVAASLCATQSMPRSPQRHLAGQGSRAAEPGMRALRSPDRHHRRTGTRPVPAPKGKGYMINVAPTRTASATASGRTSMAGASRSSSTSARWRDGGLNGTAEALPLRGFPNRGENSSLRTHGALS